MTYGSMLGDRTPPFLPSLVYSPEGCDPVVAVNSPVFGGVPQKRKASSGELAHLEDAFVRGADIAVSRSIGCGVRKVLRTQMKKARTAVVAVRASLPGLECLAVEASAYGKKCNPPASSCEEGLTKKVHSGEGTRSVSRN